MDTATRVAGQKERYQFIVIKLIWDEPSHD